MTFILYHLAESVVEHTFGIVAAPCSVCERVCVFLCEYPVFLPYLWILKTCRLLYVAGGSSKAEAESSQELQRRQERATGRRDFEWTVTARHSPRVRSTSNRKRPRESDYEADEDNDDDDDDDSDARSHPNVKKTRRYEIVSDEEEEPGTSEDDKTKDPDYNPFFKNYEDMFRDPRKKREEAARNQEMTKEESVGSNTEEKPPEPIRQPFKNIHGDDGFVEDDWYEPRGPESLPYHYSEKDVRYILKRRAEKRAAAEEKEVIDLTGNSD